LLLGVCIKISQNSRAKIENCYLGMLILVFIMIVALSIGSSTAATPGNTSKYMAGHNVSNSQPQLRSEDTSSSNFNLENQFRSAGSDGYPNPGKIVNNANYCEWVWTNIIIKNNGPDDSNITIHDQGTGFVFYNAQIGWKGWVRINDGTGWKKDTKFDVKTGTGTYSIPNGSSYQIAILGYVNGTGTIRNDVTEIYQDTQEPTIYPSSSKTLQVPDAAIIRLNGEFRKSLNGSPIKTATYKSWVYSVTHAVNQGPNNSKAVFRIDTYGLSTNGIYAVSRDNGNTWNLGDNSFDFKSGLWTTTIQSNGSWLLAVYSKITKSNSPRSTVYLLSQDTYNPYCADNVRPKCLIVFDDGNQEQYSTAFKYMQSLGITGTDYVNGFNIGTVGVLTVDELKEMVEAGWVIGNHGYHHKDLIQLSDDEIRSEISNGINFLTSMGLPEGALNLAYPGGYYNDDVLDIMKSLGVLTGRSTNGAMIYSLNGVDLYKLPAYTILNTTSVSTVKGYVNNAVQSGSTIILLFHNISPISSDSYVYTDADFKAVMDYIYSTGIDCMNINQLYSQATDIPINIPPSDLDSNTILPGVESTGLVNTTSSLDVPTPIADIEIRINASSNSVGYGDKVTYRITVINNGPDTAENVTVGDWLNGDFFKYISDDGNGAYDPNTVIWTVGDLENGESKVLNLVVQIVTSNTIVTNTATYNSGTTDDSNLDNNYQKIDIRVAPRTYISVNSASAYVGDSVKLEIKLVDENKDPIANKVVHLTINGMGYDATTNSNGVATIIYTTDKTGTFNLEVNFYKNPNFSSSSGSNILTVLKIPTNITCSNSTGYKGNKTVLKAILQDINSKKYLANETVEFIVNGNTVGTAKTDMFGTAMLNYTVMQNAGSYNITALFKQNSNYSTSYVSSILNVLRIPTSIKLNSTKGYINDTVQLIATVLNSYKNVTISNQTVKFYVSKSLVGSAVTNKSGIAIFNYKLNMKTSGTYPVTGVILNDLNNIGSTATAPLIVKRISTTMNSNVILTSKASSKNKNSKLLTTIKFRAELRNPYKNKSLAGKEINFFLNGILIGKSKTNSSGIATINYKSKPTTKIQTFKAYFKSDNTYIGCSTTKKFKITK